ncbi:MAG: molybdopterin molybdotransferase MoeA [Methylobacteriaceae bacterium]|nr:molybdopterin molybdotransferase MoeA [Methylobacteriaceae bacterium]
MAQLSSDAFAFGDALLRLEAAHRLIAERVAPLPATQEITLAEADGRVLAAPLIAAIDLPPFANSAVDGYAARFDDLAADGPTELPVSGRAAAGRPLEGEARAGAALRIFTGAATPAGLDVVFMQEDVEIAGDRVRLPHGLSRFSNLRPAGEDIARGEIAIAAGRRLTPQDAALAAALGADRLTVRARPRVGVFSTGDELAEPGAPLSPGAIYDANRFALAALVARAGGAPVDLGRLPDDRAAIRAGLREASARCDLLVTSGGVSTGEEDHVRAALEAEGALAFWRVAIKPGRPVAMGVIAGCPLIGLPGNPAAVFVTFAQIARPVIAALSGEAWRAPRALPVIADFAYAKKAGRREYVRASLVVDAGRALARKFEREGAGVVTSLTRTDGLVELAEETTRVAPGETVGFIPWAMLA